MLARLLKLVRRPAPAAAPDRPDLADLLDALANDSAADAIMMTFDADLYPLSFDGVTLLDPSEN
jgi:hypothetical protein